MMNTQAPDMEVKIDKTSIVQMEGKRVVLFHLRVALAGETWTIKRRFRDFAKFHSLIRGAFEGHHLLRCSHR